MTTKRLIAPAFLLASIFAFTGALSLAGSAQSVLAHSSEFAGKTFVVTGATSGIGRDVAVELGRRHANVVLAAQRTDLLRAVARDVRIKGGTPLVVTADAKSPADMSRVRRAAVRRFGKIDAWINAAGVAVIPHFWDAPPDDYSRLIDVNISSVTYGSREALRQFRTQNYGTLVNVGSVDTTVPLVYEGSYTKVKAEVLGLGRALNRELRQEGVSRTIKVATVMPELQNPPRRDHVTYHARGSRSRIDTTDVSPKTVNAVVRATAHPREEIPSPCKGSASFILDNFAPDFVQIIANEIEE